MKLLKEVLVTLIIAILVFALVRITVQSFKVEGISMLPGIQPGEYLLANKLVYFIRDPQQGEVIVFHSPQPQRPDLIKRVIGLPGDEIRIEDGTVFVNDNALTESYVNESPTYTLPSIQVPEDNYFVLGDNRNHSQDSHIGWTVPRDSVIGQAWVIVWPPRQWGTIKPYPSVAIKLLQQELMCIAGRQSCLTK